MYLSSHRSFVSPDDGADGFGWGFEARLGRPLGLMAIRPCCFLVEPTFLLSRVFLPISHLWLHDPDDSMHVVWHNHERIHFYVLPYRPSFQPLLMCDFPKLVQQHFAFLYLAKEMASVVRNQRDKVKSCLRIVVSLEPNGPAMVDFRIVIARLIFSSFTLARIVICPLRR